MVTLEQAYMASDFNTWEAYWKQCRITGVKYRYPGFSTETDDNPLQIRWREIPEGEDVTVPHPEIEVQMMETRWETEAVKAMMASLPDDHLYKTVEGIEQASAEWFEARSKEEEDFAEFLDYKANGNLKIETVDETKPISWESIRNASTEELFQTKLEIFESPPVQESENKEYRQNIRKSSSIIEAMYWYYLIVNSDVAPEDANTPKVDIPDDIDMLLDTDISSEAIFKYKLQIFEKENVQNSENKKARAKIRKATNLVELLTAYSEIVEDKKE